ncbi:MAG: DNA double-strand break repair nuclease NurA [Aquificaceae bacterium]
MKMKLFEKYNLSLSPHQPSEVDILEVEESEQFVNFEEEPRTYEGYTPKGDFGLVFVDGVRRTEGLVHIKDDSSGEGFEGAFVSLGAGALRVSYGRLNLLGDSLVEKETRRILFLRGSLPIRKVLDFDTVCVDGELSAEVNRYMKDKLEAEVALRAWKRFPKDLLVCDGTLSYRLKNTSCIGFIKSIKRLYFDKRYINVLYQLKPGQRSPIIKVHYQQKQEEKEKVDKYTWYVKLSNHEGLHGLARVEAFPQEGLGRIADLSAGLLHLFASQPFQDRRSPQNLLSIGSLERYLRQYLGSYHIIRREIESFLYA